MKFVRISPVLALILAIILASGVALAWTVFSGTLANVTVEILTPQAYVSSIDIYITSVKSGYDFAHTECIDDGIEIINAKELVVSFMISNFDENESAMFISLMCKITILDQAGNEVAHVEFNLKEGDLGPKSITLPEGTYDVRVDVWGTAGYPQPTDGGVAQADFSIDVVVETPSY